MKKWMGVALGAALLLPGALGAQTMEDRAAVERAAMDYIEGFYEGDQDKLRRSVHPEVLKFGFSKQGDGPYRRVPMSFDQMLGFAQRVKDSGNHPDASAPREVEVMDVLDQTAAVKVYAWWGSDYMLMAKYEGEWKIVQILWQSPPT